MNAIGVEVYWNDPDGEFSGWRIIQSFKSDEVVILIDESGTSITEANISELEG